MSGHSDSGRRVLTASGDAGQEAQPEQSRPPGTHQVPESGGEANGGQGEPLQASWTPEIRADSGPRAPVSGVGRTRFARVKALYGWRIYAVPVLLVITLLVVIDTV
ncbi:MAG: hypothetical protein ACRDRL_06575, partial [Sciscionella sp.]